uniref:Ig-like domain-containing protein n=1 Tax=Labrus bergylta TaxID=56723 RepID=A0A3Q3GRB1_9LABR
MMSLTLIAALLFSLLSVSVSEFHTVDAQPGEEVTLLCSNFTLFPLHITWFRLNSTSNTKSFFFGEFQNSSFDVTSNSTHLFLKMKQVDFSHSGLYFCGFMVFLSFIGRDSYLNMILGALVVFLSAVIFTLVVLIRKPQTARKEDQDPQQSENVASEDVTYPALSFHSQAKSRRRPAAENELETHVLYSTTR